MKGWLFGVHISSRHTARGETRDTIAVELDGGALAPWMTPVQHPGPGAEDTASARGPAATSLRRSRLKFDSQRSCRSRKVRTPDRIASSSRTSAGSGAGAGRTWIASSAGSGARASAPRARRRCPRVHVGRRGRPAVAARARCARHPSRRGRPRQLRVAVEPPSTCAKGCRSRSSRSRAATARGGAPSARRMDAPGPGAPRRRGLPPTRAAAMMPRPRGARQDA